jgi:hypothetical protein
MEDVPFPTLKKRGRKYVHQVPAFLETDLVEGTSFFFFGEFKK